MLQQTVEHKYDYQNRWVERSVTIGSTTTVDKFVYDGNQIILRLDEQNGVQDRFLWGPAVHMLLAQEAVSGGVARATMSRGWHWLASAESRVHLAFNIIVHRECGILICESKPEPTQHVIFAMLVLGGVQGDCQCAARRFVLVFRSARGILLFNGKP